MKTTPVCSFETLQSDGDCLYWTFGLLLGTYGAPLARANESSTDKVQQLHMSVASIRNRLARRILDPANLQKYAQRIKKELHNRTSVGSPRQSNVQKYVDDCLTRHDAGVFELQLLADEFRVRIYLYGAPLATDGKPPTQIEPEDGGADTTRAFHIARLEHGFRCVVRPRDCGGTQSQPQPPQENKKARLLALRQARAVDAEKNAEAAQQAADAALRAAAPSGAAEAPLALMVAELRHVHMARRRVEPRGGKEANNPRSRNLGYSGLALVPSSARQNAVAPPASAAPAVLPRSHVTECATAECDAIMKLVAVPIVDPRDADAAIKIHEYDDEDMELHIAAIEDFSHRGFNGPGDVF